MQATNVEAEGVLFVEVTDPHSGKAFRFYDFEHTVALALDGRPLDQVAIDLRNHAELELTTEQLAAFADQLQALGFLENLENGSSSESGGVFPPLPADDDNLASGNGLDEAGEAEETPVLAAQAPEPRTPEPDRIEASESTPDEPPAAQASQASTSPTPTAPSLPAVARAPVMAVPPPPVFFAAPPAPKTPPMVFTAPGAPPNPLPGLSAGAGGAPSFSSGSSSSPAASSTSSPYSAASGPAPSAFTPSSPSPNPFATSTPGPNPFSVAAPVPGAFTGPAPVPNPFTTPTPGEPTPVLAPPSPAAPAPEAGPAFRSGNGAYASGELRTAQPAGAAGTSPADSPRSWKPLSPAPEPAPSLRLVPAPASQAAEPSPVPLGLAPTEPHVSPGFTSDLDEASLEPDPFAEVDAAAAAAAAELPAGADPDLDQPVMNTGDPSFPPPVAEDPTAPVQRLELSMTRRFITPERARPATATRRIWLAYGALGVGAALVVFVMVYKFFATSEPPPISVRVVVPSPSSVYRWWDGTARVQQTGGAPLTLPREGKVAEVVPEGTRFAAGDVLAMLESAKPFRGAISHNKSRLAYYEQMRDTMTQQDNRVRLRDAETKIAEKKRLITEAQEAFAAHALLASAAGEVAEALVARGATVQAGDPVLRLKSSGFRASFELPKADADRARQLGFCRAEVEGKPLECSLAADGGDETHVAIELPNDPGLDGKSVRLARDRLDAVFSVPLSALVRVGDSDRLFVVPPSGRAEMRVVAVADRGPGGATVTQGLDVGDRVIVEVPSGLRADARVLIASSTSR